MGKAPAFQFYPGDWIRDTRVLSNEAKGCWIDILCQMWFAIPRGILSLDIEGWSHLLQSDLAQTERVLGHLAHTKVCDMIVESDGKVTLVNRRMEREGRTKDNSAKRQENYRKRQRTGLRQISNLAQSNAESNGETGNSNAEVTHTSSSFILHSSEKEKREKEKTIPPSGGLGGGHPLIAWSTGGIPGDVILALDHLPASRNASEFQDNMVKLLKTLGFMANKEMLCADRGDGRPGKIDILAVRGEEVLAIECDRRKGRDKSIEKLIRFKQPALILLREREEPLPEVPVALDTPDFAKAWSEWIEERAKGRRRTLSARAVKGQFERMREWGAERAVRALRYSIAQGYDGIVEAPVEKRPGHKANGSVHGMARPAGLVLPEGYDVEKGTKQ